MSYQESVQRGHLIYEDELKRQPDLKGLCWSGENHFAHLMTRRKRYSFWGLFVILIWAQIQMGRLIYLKCEKKWPEFLEPDKLP